MRRLVPLLALMLLAAGCGGGDGGVGEAGDEAGSGEITECQEVDAPEAREPGESEQPTESLDTATTWALVFDTSCGSFTVTLDPASAPNTTASLVSLAEDGYFDDTIFYRVVPGFVIQGGDPTQTGGGDPGYQTVDEPPPTAKYVKGVVAMAKADPEPAGTSGSQFFVVTAADSGLEPLYAVVGEVTDGMDTIDRIAALAVEDGPPSMPVVVNSVTVSES